MGNRRGAGVGRPSQARSHVTADWIPVGAATREEGQPQRFDVAGRAVMVTVFDGTPYALDGDCLHRGASLSDGICRDGVVTCPAHWWRYDLRTGRLQGSQDVFLASYPSRIVEGVIEVLVPAQEAPRSMRQILLDHARANPQ